MFKVLVAPTAYKGCFTPGQVAGAIAEGFKLGYPGIEIIKLPVADGGDGTVESLHNALGGEMVSLRVEGPVGNPVTANWLKLDYLAVVELACASGIAWLSPGELAPLTAHTRGLGRVICDAIDHGCRKIVATVGGSASTDGGTGALSVLGAKFLGVDQKPIPAGGGRLNELKDISLFGLKERLTGIELTVATDVTNPLLGKNGAAQRFSPQKGAGAAEMALLESGLERFADLLEAKTGLKLRNDPGAGAAGGTAFGFACAAGANVVNGFEWIAELIGLADLVAVSDLVVTGEGLVDRESFSGKVLGGLRTMCYSSEKPLWVIPARMDQSLSLSELTIAGVEEAAPHGKRADIQDIKEAACRVAQKVRISG